MNPDKYTINEHFLKVDEEHTLYIQDWGNPIAQPIVFLHGGPGACIKDHHKQRFDPKLQRIIFFDQRGAGKSTPTGSLHNNTTKELIEDIKKIAVALKLKNFILTGGSWGVCLALAYALKYPERVNSLVLQGIYTGSKSETEYLDSGEAWRIYFPDVWDNYLNRTPKEWHHDPTAYHQKQALGKDPIKAKLSSYAYSELEGSLMNIDDRHNAEDYKKFDPNSMKIELHYLSNDCFLPDRYILDNAHKLKMPVWIIQGRYDMVCPPTTAYELHKKIATSHLLWTTAGHGNDRSNYDLMHSTLLQLSQA